MLSVKQQLIQISEKLHQPFPYRDTDKIQEDFLPEFSKLSQDENWLIADYNTYCMNIAGSLSYCLEDLTDEIPKDQIEMLKFSFFDFYKQYQFFEAKITKYDGFYQEYQLFEEERKLLLVYFNRK